MKMREALHELVNWQIEVMGDPFGLPKAQSHRARPAAAIAAALAKIRRAGHRLI